jgi:hypothetical protein
MHSDIFIVKAGGTYSNHYAVKGSTEASKNIKFQNTAVQKSLLYWRYAYTNI